MGNVRHFHPAVSEKPAFHKASQTTKKAELRKIVIQPSAIGRGDKIRTCGPYVPNVVLYQTEPHLVDELCRFLQATYTVYHSLEKKSSIFSLFFFF